MIEEMAQVVKVDNHQIWVTSLKTGGCSGCAQKAGCSTQAVASLLKQKPIAVEVFSVRRLKVGDQVLIAIDESLLLIATLLMYLFPLMVLFAGGGLVDWLLPEHFPSEDTWIAIGALLGFGLSLGLIHRAQHLFLFNIYTRPVVVKKL